MKIAIIGYSGSGKSSLARDLGELSHSEVLYLDSIHFLSGWVERDSQVEKDMLNEFMDNKDSWVIDGNYEHLAFQRRLDEADEIIFMNFNRFICLYRALKRRILYHGKSRESITEGCIEKLDFEFIKWILYDGRSAKHQKRYHETLQKYRDKVTVIKNQRQLSAYKEYKKSSRK